MLFFLFDENTNTETEHLLEHITAHYLYNKAKIKNTLCRTQKNCFYVVSETDLNKRIKEIYKKVTKPSKEEFIVAKNQIILEKEATFGEKESPIEEYVGGEKKRFALKYKTYSEFKDEIKKINPGYAVCLPNKIVKSNFEDKQIYNYKEKLIKKNGEKTILLDLPIEKRENNFLNAFIDFSYVLKGTTLNGKITYDDVGCTYQIETDMDIKKVIRTINERIKKLDPDKLYKASYLQFYAEYLDYQSYKYSTYYLSQLFGYPLIQNKKMFKEKLKDFDLNEFIKVVI